VRECKWSGIVEDLYHCRCTRKCSPVRVGSRHVHKVVWACCFRARAHLLVFTGRTCWRPSHTCRHDCNTECNTRRCLLLTSFGLSLDRLWLLLLLRYYYCLDSYVSASRSACKFTFGAVQFYWLLVNAHLDLVTTYTISILYQRVADRQTLASANTALRIYVACVWGGKTWKLD